MKTKHELRARIKEEKKKYSPEDLQKMADKICESIETSQDFFFAKNVMAFWNLPDEPNLRPLLNKYADKKNIFLPIIEDGEIRIARFVDEANMEVGAFNISEPSKDLKVSQMTAIDLVLVPGVAFDKNGNRLGRGKGYYDHFLTGRRVEKVGVCFPFQVVEEIPTEPFDIVMDKIIFD